MRAEERRCVATRSFLARPSSETDFGTMTTGPGLAVTACKTVARVQGVHRRGGGKLPIKGGKCDAFKVMQQHSTNFDCMCTCVSQRVCVVANPGDAQV